MKFLNDSSTLSLHTPPALRVATHHLLPSAFDKCENNVRLIDFSPFLSLSVTIRILAPFIQLVPPSLSLALVRPFEFFFFQSFLKIL